MALAEALKTNTTLKTLGSAALPSNPLADVPCGPTSMHASCTGPLHVLLRRLRSLGSNDLGPKGGMSLAEALKSNTTLTELGSAALPSNPSADALRPHSMHARCTGPLHLFLPRLRSLRDNKLGPEVGMALAEALKSNTTSELGSAALPSNPSADALRPHEHMHARCTGPLHVFLRRLRSLFMNKLGPEGGMALAEALKTNTTLTELRSAALPSTPPAHALRPHSMHARCTGPLHCFLRRLRSLDYNKLGPEGGMVLAEALTSNTTLELLMSAALPSNPPAHASRSFPALHASVHLTPFLVLPWKHLNTCPARALHATNHSLRVSRTSPARAQPTHSLHTHRASCLLAAAPVPPTPPHPAWTAATPFFAHGGWRARAHPPACNLPVAVWWATTSAPTPSRPSERPPATASSFRGSSKPAGSGLQLHVSS